MKIYMVGGAVRDRLLGRPVIDRDWVVIGSTAAELSALGFKCVGSDFPVFLHPDTHEEYALARAERKTAPGYHGFVFDTAPTVTLEDDLRRRDLTINALAEDESGCVIDPFNGRQDLQHGILRHISPAFAEDPVRILRVARFAARYDFQVADETLQLMRQMVSAGETQALVAERVWSELERALSEPCPQRFIQVLHDVGALPDILPELAALFGVPQAADLHPEIDTGLHSLLALAQAAALSAVPEVRFAALVHDLGKAQTAKADWPDHPGHAETGAERVRELCLRLRAPRKFRELGELVALHHLQCHSITGRSAAEVCHFLGTLDAFRRPERFEQFLLSCTADARGRTGREATAYPQAQLLRTALQAARTVVLAAARVNEDKTALASFKQQLEEKRVETIEQALTNYRRHARE